MWEVESVVKKLCVKVQVFKNNVSASRMLALSFLTYCYVLLSLDSYCYLLLYIVVSCFLSLFVFTDFYLL